jgi:hypothetical protein
MRTDLWSQFGDLAEPPRKYLATVTAHNADGTTSITTPEGYQTRVLGRLETDALPYNVWVLDGRVLEAAPAFPITNVEV